MRRTPRFTLARLSHLAARYRAQRFDDVDKLSEGHETVASCLDANAAPSCAGTSAATASNSAAPFTSTDEFFGDGTSYFRRMENDELAAALTGDEATFTAELASE